MPLLRSLARMLVVVCVFRASVAYCPHKRRNKERREMPMRQDVAVEPIVATLEDGEAVSLAVVETGSPEVEQVLALLQSELSEGRGVLPFDSWPQALDTLQQSSFVVGSARLRASKEGDLVGGCFLWPTGGWNAEQHACELLIVTAQAARRRGIATLLARRMMEVLPQFGFESVRSFRTYASNRAAVQLLRGLEFKLIGVLPRAAYLPGARGAVDAFLFCKDIRQKQVKQKGGEMGNGDFEDRGERGDTVGRDDERWMMEAEKQATAAGNKGEVPVGAVIVRDGCIIGRGSNEMISSCDPSAHAEILAIRDAASNSGNYRLNGCTLYVTLEPCIMCSGGIIHSRLSRVVFGARDPKAGCAGSVLDVLQGGKFNHVVQVQGGVREEETAAILSDFFAQRRKSPEK